MSFRARLLAAALMTLAVGLAVLVVGGNILLAEHVRSETSRTLRERAEAQVAALAVRGNRVRLRHPANDALLDKRSWVFVGERVIERPSGLPRSLDAAAIALGHAARLAEADAPAEYRLRAQPVPAQRSGRPAATVVVAESTETLEDLQRRVLIGSLALAGLVLLAGGLAIRRAVGGALRPVAAMTATAEDWGAHDLERRFALGPARDELTSLAATLDGLLARIAASRRHEQRLTSEIAHELRTPIAGLRGRAELALQAEGEEADAQREAALQAVVTQAARLDTAIDSLLAEARREFAADGVTADLGSVAQEFEGLELRLPPALPPAEGDPALVRRMLAPLVDNARRHARSEVRLEVSADERSVRVAIRDDGPGLAAGTAERVFEPGFRGDERPGGAGLGLPLARRLARSCGGDVNALDGPGGCFVLSLPRADS